MRHPVRMERTSRRGTPLRWLRRGLLALVALYALYLLAGNVFTKDLIDTWISYKRDNEIKPLSLRPHPFEFELYYGV